MIPRPEDWTLPSRGVIVIKLGGSMLLWPGLPDRLRRFLDWARSEGAMTILMTGGGEPANFIRSMDETHHLHRRISHDMAVRAMDLTSHCLAALMEPDLKVVDHFSEFADIWNRGMTPVLAPFRFLTEVDMQQNNALPPSWRVTSDSIAARIAEFVKAHDLILLKSRDVPPGTSIKEAVHLGLVDPMLPEIAARVPRVISLNFRDSTALARELLHQKKTH